MKKLLLAVDDTKGSKAAVNFSNYVCKCLNPDTVLLCYIEEYEGRSLMTANLPMSELSTLKEVLKGTDYKKKLDEKADAIIGFYRKALEANGIKGIKPVVRMGHPAEEILSLAKEEGAEMIVMGSRGKRVSHRFMGSVSREVANSAEVPVLIVK